MGTDDYRYTSLKNCQKVVLKEDLTAGMKECDKRTYPKGSEFFIVNRDNTLTLRNKKGDTISWVLPSWVEEVK